MRAVKGRDTEPERLLRSAMWRLGLRFRKHDPRLPGRPDASFPKARVAVFVDGDFWHGRKWAETGKLPDTNPEFWRRKFNGNLARDAKADRALSDMGWLSLRIWESDIRKHPVACARLVRAIISRRRREQRSDVAADGLRHGRGDAVAD